MTANVSLIDRTMVRQHLSRVWLPKLSSSQFAVVDMIYDRTLAWGRTDCAISMTEFAKGSKKGHTGGTGLSVRTIYNCLRTLATLGLINREAKAGRRTRYSLNVSAMMPTPKKAPVKGLQPPKKAKDTPAKAASPTPAIPARAIRKERTGEGRTKGAPGAHQPQKAPPEPTPEPPVKPRLKAALDAVVNGALEVSRKRSAQALATDKLKAMQWKWIETAKAEWPDYPVMAWSPRVRGQIKHALRNGLFDGVDAAAFTEWVVKQWAALANSKFKWMVNFPNVPDPQLVATFIYKLVHVYADRESFQREVKKRGSEGLYAKHRRGGMSQEDAREATDAAEKMKTMVSKEEHQMLKRELEAEQRARAHYEALAREKHTANTNAHKPSLDDF